MTSTLCALGAIALWATLASLGVLLGQVPPFLLTGIALLIGSTLALPRVLHTPHLWRVPARTLALGVYGLFGFHFLLFIALRHAPAVEANLVNYLWPLFMVVLAPLLLPGMRLRAIHVLAALLGFCGAALAILGARPDGPGTAIWAWGYLPALGSALIQRVAPFPTAAIGLFGLTSGLLSLLCHWLLEPPVSLSLREWLLLGVMGAGPLGSAFYLWDKALKRGDARQIAILSYLTPLASTALLMLSSGRALSPSIALAALLIIGGAVLGARAR